jgi:LysR family transcriptional regulator, benzoate and cis,cis-muconate-responsive activator of ben and cat genes
MNGRVDLRRLRYFVAVAEELHFGRAAARLGMAQPPLTQQIQKLERELGYDVFSRQRRQTALTDAGRILLEEATRLFRESDRAIERVRRAGRGESGEITVGTPPSVMLGRLPIVIRRYRERYPDVHFTLRELSTSAIADELRAGALDIGLLREVPSIDSLETELLFREPIVAVLPKDDELTRRTRLSLAHLSRKPFVLFPRRLGEAFYDRLLNYCQEAGFSPHLVQDATQWQSVVTFVEAGMGVSLAPACVQRFRWPGVVFRRLPGLSTNVFVCTAKTSPAVLAFRKLMLSELSARHDH